MSAPSVREPMTAPARRVGLVLALGGLLIVVDTTVTIVALPAMVADLDSTLPTIQWVTIGYVLGMVAVIPVAGWQRRVSATDASTSPHSSPSPSPRCWPGGRGARGP